MPHGGGGTNFNEFCTRAMLIKHASGRVILSRKWRALWSYWATGKRTCPPENKPIHRKTNPEQAYSKLHVCFVKILCPKTKQNIPA
jgi:hypothetical protein